MEFTTFLLYFTASMFIYRLTMGIIMEIMKYFAKRSLQKKIKSGKVKMMTLDDLIEQIKDQQQGDDGTWH